MAEVVAPGSPANPPSPPPPPPPPPRHAPQGKKRAADTSLEHEQRLSKRFDLLNLGIIYSTTHVLGSMPQLTLRAVDSNGSRLYIPVPGSSDPSSPHSQQNPIATPDPLAFLPKRLTRTRKPPSERPTSTDGMQVDDTPHRVYIHDLNAELSDIESDEDTPVFLPDIEKHLSKIPKHVLLGPPPKPSEHNQVVLYNVPASLSVPAERDGVRKAIVEARQRIRERQGVGAVAEIQQEMGGGISTDAGDDAMDLD